MSRIHDALKKAERERVAVQLPDVPLSSSSAETDPNLDEQVGTGLDAGASAAPVPVLPSLLASERFLRFDDLLARCAHPHWELDPNASVFSKTNSVSHGAEQFRTLRSRLYKLRSKQQIRTLLVTSAVPAEGKTFVAGNLAQAIVRQPDRRVLLIDADLRCARLHLLFGAPSSPGLTDYLRGEVDEAAVIQHGPDGNLCLIAGGSEVTNPSELLSNGRIATLLNRVSTVFDWIILDSAPCLPVADANILADYCDAILLVVRAGVTPAEVAQRAIQELQNRNMAGVILNAVQESQNYGGYYYQNNVYGSERKRAEV